MNIALRQIYLDFIRSVAYTGFKMNDKILAKDTLISVGSIIPKAKDYFLALEKRQNMSEFNPDIMLKNMKLDIPRNKHQELIDEFKKLGLVGQRFETKKYYWRVPPNKIGELYCRNTISVLTIPELAPSEKPDSRKFAGHYYVPKNLQTIPFMTVKGNEFEIVLPNPLTRTDAERIKKLIDCYVVDAENTEKGAKK